MVGGLNISDNAAIRKHTSLLLHTLQKINRVLLEHVRSPAHMLQRPSRRRPGVGGQPLLPAEELACVRACMQDACLHTQAAGQRFEMIARVPEQELGRKVPLPHDLLTKLAKDGRPHCLQVLAALLRSAVGGVCSCCDAQYDFDTVVELLLARSTTAPGPFPVRLKGPQQTLAWLSPPLCLRHLFP